MSDSFATPRTVAHGAPLSLGFHRQEYWSGLPFPSLGDLPNPGIEPESPALQVNFFFYHWTTMRKKVLVTQSCLTLCNSMDCSHPGSSFHGILQVRILECVPFPSTGDLPDPGIKPRSPALQADSSLSEPSGEPESPETNLSFFNSCAFSAYWNIWPCCSDGDFLYNFLQCLHCFRFCI